MACNYEQFGYYVGRVVARIKLRIKSESAQRLDVLEISVQVLRPNLRLVKV